MANSFCFNDNCLRQEEEERKVKHTGDQVQFNKLQVSVVFYFFKFPFMRYRAYELVNEEEDENEEERTVMV